MNKIKILLVEDDLIIATDISMQLQQLGYAVTGILPRGEDVLSHIEQNAPDIVIMDVHLKGELDGVQTAQLVYEKHQLPIIFLTANADEVTFNRAKATKPFAFISKPFKRRDLIRAIELVISRLAMEEEQASTSSQDETEIPTSYILSDRIFVRYRNQMIKIFLEEIYFAQADRNYCKIQTKNREFLMSIPLKKLMEKLPLDNFIRTHRSYVVNIGKIDSISQHYDYVMISENKIPISRGLKEEVISRLQIL